MRWITPERRLAILIRDSFTCCNCGRDLKDANSNDITLDHLEPRLKGRDGKVKIKETTYGQSINHESNLVVLCYSCNQAKGKRHYRDFYFGGALERVMRQRYLPINLQLAKDIIKDKLGSNDY